MLSLLLYNQDDALFIISKTILYKIIYLIMMKKFRYCKLSGFESVLK